MFHNRKRSPAAAGKAGAALLLALALLLGGCGSAASSGAVPDAPASAAPADEAPSPTAGLLADYIVEYFSTVDKFASISAIPSPTGSDPPLRLLAAAVAELTEVLPWTPDYRVLVNQAHPLPEGWEDAVREHLTPVRNSMGETLSLETRTAKAFLALREALLAQGIHIELTSGFRSVGMQVETIRYLQQTYGPAYAATYAAAPGYSEHHTGLAADFEILGAGGGDVMARLRATLPEYGFILRYPPGKEDVTGVSSEPWHLRYVGFLAARVICDGDLTLEEYLER